MAEDPIAFDPPGGLILAPAPGMDDAHRRRWVVKDNLYAEWRELTGAHTATEIWAMRRTGAFSVAMPLSILNVQKEDQEFTEGINGRA